MSEQIALQQGYRGAGVLALQNALIQRGYELPQFGADGAYGPETAEAVRAWKKDNSTDLLSPIADGSYVTERELDLIGVAAVGQEFFATLRAWPKSYSKRFKTLRTARAIRVR